MRGHEHSRHQVGQTDPAVFETQMNEEKGEHGQRDETHRIGDGNTIKRHAGPTAYQRKQLRKKSPKPVVLNGKSVVF